MIGSTALKRHRFADRAMEKLTERHEASQTVENIAGMRANNERLMAESLDAIQSLAGIVQAHEQRLNNLEGSLASRYMPQRRVVGSRSAVKPHEELYLRCPN